MANILDILRKRQERGFSSKVVTDFKYEAKQNSGENLNTKDLKAHFGCVNALAFSKNEQFMASGGDDRRILVWNMGKTMSNSKKPNQIMKGTHESNVFCVDFDCQMVRSFLRNISFYSIIFKISMRI